MVGRRDGNEHDVADANSLDASNPCVAPGSGLTVSCRNAEEGAFVGAVVFLERRNHIAVSGLPVDGGMKVGKCRP